jgi:16S rRNA (guanine(966)-N(2))-methyltransferase RsmD
MHRVFLYPRTTDLRIIAGTYRSRRIIAPPEEITRPTSDRLRETLFNVIAPQVPGSRFPGTRFLDLYAGSGAVGIEALSRGAAVVYAIESNKKAVRIIEQNLNSLGITDGPDTSFVLIPGEVAAGLRQVGNQPFDIVFLDPPYRERGAYEQVLRLLAELDLVSSSGMVIAEHEKHFDPGDSLDAFTRYRTLKQGDAVLSFYRRSM